MTTDRPISNGASVPTAAYLNEIDEAYHSDDVYPVTLLALPPGWRPKETPTPAPAPATRRALLYSDVEADEFASLGAMSCCDGY